MLEPAGVDKWNVVVDNVGHVEPHFIEPQSLGSTIPRELPEKGIEVFRVIAEPSQVLTEDDDDVRACLSCFRNQLELI